MATEIDIAVTTTTYDVTIVAEPNEYIVNITTGGSGGTQTLAQTLVLGNQTGGENILVNNADAIKLENTSLLKKGTYNFAGENSGGISRICSVGYEDNWQSGIRHVFDNNGLIRHSTNCFDVIPDSSFDNTLRFKVDSLWTLDNGTTYKCTDASTGAAVWEIYNNFIPDLTQVLTVGDIQTNEIGIGTDVIFTIELAWRLTENYINSTAVGTGGLFLDKEVVFPIWSNVKFQGGYAGVPPEEAVLDPYLFTTDAIVYYQGSIITSLVIQPQEICSLRTIGTDGDGINVWYLTIGNKSSGGGSGTVTSVGLTMPSAFSVANTPVTTSGTLEVTTLGTASQYIDGVGDLRSFPSFSGGGSSVSYYLNGSVNQGTFGGSTYYEFSKTPILGAGTDFTINANGYIASFITDANDPAQIEIPAGNWNFEMFFSSSSAGGSPNFYVELYKYNGATFTLISSSSATPEPITNGIAISLYLTSLAVPQTTLALTDRLAVRVFVNNSSKTIKLHTEDNHLCQIITSFASGLTALNGLTKQIQVIAPGTSGTDFNISSVDDTHTFNLPTASASNRGALSSADWSAFNSKASTAYVDAKVTDAIVDGVTTVAPSQNAVFDALQFTRRLITKGTGSVTGTLTETILTSLTIPANTLDSSCFIWSTMDFFKTNSGSVTARLYINSANTLTGATLLGFIVLGSNRNVSFNRKLYLSGTSLDLLTSSASSQVNNEFIELLFVASTVLTVNPANDIFFIYTTQNDVVGTVATNKMATVQKMKL